jgi:hypothetical protein
MEAVRLRKPLTWCHLASGIKNDLANFSISAATTTQPSRTPYSFCMNPLADECANVGGLPRPHRATSRARRASLWFGELVGMACGISPPPNCNRQKSVPKVVLNGVGDTPWKPAGHGRCYSNEGGCVVGWGRKRTDFW